MPAPDNTNKPYLFIDSSTRWTDRKYPPGKLSAEEQNSILDLFMKIGDDDLCEDNYLDELYPALKILHSKGYDVYGMLEDAVFHREDMLSNASINLERIANQNVRLRNILDQVPSHPDFSSLYEIVVSVYKQQGRVDAEYADDLMSDCLPIIREITLEVISKDRKNAGKKDGEEKEK